MEMQPGKSGYIYSILPFLGCRWLCRKPEEELGRNTDLNQILVQGIVVSSLLRVPHSVLGKSNCFCIPLKKCKNLQTRLYFLVADTNPRAEDSGSHSLIPGLLPGSSWDSSGAITQAAAAGQGAKSPLGTSSVSSPWGP